MNRMDIDDKIRDILNRANECLENMRKKINKILLKLDSENIILPTVVFIALSIFFSIFFAISFSQAWVSEKVGKDSYDFVINTHLLGYEKNYTMYEDATETSENNIKENKKYAKYYKYGLIVTYLLIFIFAVVKFFTKTEYIFLENYHNVMISITGVFLGVFTGLASGSYLLLISLRKNYLSQLDILMSQRIPFEDLPLTIWDATYQILCIGYIGFAIISMFLLTSLLMRIGYIELHYKTLKFSSDVYLITAISLSVLFLWLFSYVEEYF